MGTTDSNVTQLYDLLNHIPVTKDNAGKIQEIKDAIGKNDLKKALDGIKELNVAIQNKKKELKKRQTKKEKDEQDALEAEKKEFEAEQIKEDEVERFPKELQDLDLEEDYIGLLLYDPRYIVSYNFLYDEVCFQDERMLNLYKSVIFTEGEKYAPEAVKRALERPNLSIWHDEEAVIGAQRREWSKFIDEKNEFVNFNFKKVDDRVSFGDFASFTSFLSELIGDHPDADKK